MIRTEHKREVIVLADMHSYTLTMRTKFLYTDNKKTFFFLQQYFIAVFHICITM